MVREVTVEAEAAVRALDEAVRLGGSREAAVRGGSAGAREIVCL